MAKPRRSTSGFTLIEVLVAVGILTLMVTLFSVSLRSTIDSKNYAESSGISHHSVALGFEKFAADLQMAFLVTSPDFFSPVSPMKIVFIGTEDRIDFISFNHTSYFKDTTEAELAEISYYLDNSEEEGHGWFRREDPAVDDKPAEGGDTEALVDQVESVHFEYYDTQKKEWVKEWDSTQLSVANRLPRAVKVELVVKDSRGNDPLKFSTIADLKLYAKPIQF